METLFVSGHLDNRLNGRTQSLIDEVEGMEPNYILTVSEEDLCQFLVSKYSAEFPIFHEDDLKVINHQEVNLGLHGQKGLSVTVSVPFEGDSQFFHYRPNRFSTNPPHGQLTENEVHLTFNVADQDGEKLKRLISKQINSIKAHLDWARPQVDSYNNQLESLVKSVVSQRKQKVLDDQNMVDSLGIPIRRNPNAPKTYALPEVRRKPRLERPKASKEAFKLEPVFEEEHYDHALNLIQNMVLVMERSPKAFVHMEEEDLRNHFLVQLNGQFDGEAMGEVFNFEGKSDILLRHNGKNVFIAECKFWTGEKGLSDAIDQLIRYISWRDTKTAILLFIRRKDFSAILKKIPDTVESHSFYKETIGQEQETIFRYKFCQPDDKERELFLTVMAFNIPPKPAETQSTAEENNELVNKP